MTVYIKIFAGLCNRLFQYSYGKYLMSLGQKVKFIRAYDGNTDILDIMDLGGDENLFYTNSKNGKLEIFFIKLFAKIILRSYKVGFFQSEQFASIAHFVFKNEVLYKNDSAAKKIENSNSVSIHIRGGDYLDGENYFFNVCTETYYANALKEAQKQISSPVFFIFTNDRPYAQSLAEKCGLKDFTFFFADDLKDKNYDDGFDLFLMSRCKANIIANSTFSWWGTFLNKTPHPVICPKHWTNKPPYLKDNLLLEKWIRV